MLMVRSMGELKDGAIIRNNMIETLWNDVTLRANTLAPEDGRTVKKQIEDLTGQLQYAIILYDEGLTKDDKQLATSLWVRFFNSNCDNYEHIELLVKYVRYNVSANNWVQRDKKCDPVFVNSTVQFCNFLLIFFRISLAFSLLQIAALDKLTTEQFLRKRSHVWPSLKDMEAGKY